MKNPKKQAGYAATALSTEASSPGTLEIRAARATPCVSSSAFHQCASSAGSSGGSTQAADSATCSTVLPACAPRAEKKLREKK
jgi:hypothetical protein